jgi:hypothetical protein
LAVARKLRTYVTSLGFFDQAIAAPSMKAALEAWGSRSNLFHQGFAREVDDPDIVEATMAKPGVVLRRPIGSNAPFTESADLPTDLLDEARSRPARPSRKAGHPRSKISEKQSRKAAAAFEREQRKRESERRKDEAARAREHERRQHAIAKAQAALDEAEREHDKRASLIDEERAALDRRAKAEETRWAEQRMKLQGALRRAREE